MKFSSKHQATIITILIVAFTFVSLFHVAALLQLIPYQYLWGGRLKSLEEMYVMESVSLLLNNLFIGMSVLYRKKLALGNPATWMRIVFFITGILFLFNSIGNLFAESKLETLFGTPITVILSIFCFLLAVKNENHTG